MSKIFTTTLIFALLAVAVLAQASTTYTTTISIRKSDKLISEPKLKQVEASEASLELEIGKGKLLAISLLPDARGKLATTLEFKGKSARLALKVGEASKIIFSEHDFELRDKAGKVLQKGVLKDFPTKDLAGVSLSIECRRD